MSKIVIFGVPFSPNLGDGIIADCLAAALRQVRPGLDVTHVDLSGRRALGETIVSNRAAILRLLRYLPRPVRHLLVNYKLGKILDGLEPQWRDAIEKADLTVIGGGQIFSDADLNFCLKIARVARILHATGKPAIIHAAGVAGNWTHAGTRLFQSLADCDLRAAGLRDEGSILAWIDQFGGHGPEPRLTRDPGLLAAECYGPSLHDPKGIGLCITDPLILGYHADAGPRQTVTTTGFAEIAVRLADVRPPVTLFCNGAAEDQAAVQAVWNDPVLLRLRATDRIRLANTPETPTELAHLVAGFEGVVAHRLHACILAYAYDRPVIGMGWDGKLRSFFASVGLEDNFLAAEDISPEAIARAARLAFKAGISPLVRADVLAETRNHVTLILDDLP